MRARTRGYGVVVLAVLSLGVSGGPAWAQDTKDIRFYLGLRVGQTIINEEPLPGLKFDDPITNLTNITAGVNLGRYFGIELSGDYHFKMLQIPGIGKIGEYGMFALIPQIRLRYPLLDGFLTPYVLGGVGVGFNDFNDRENPGIGLGIHARDTAPVASVGGGIEYFIANNIALGVEAKYLFSRWHEMEVEGLVARDDADLDSLLVSAGLRLLFPETPAARQVETPYAGAKRLYIGIRLGAAYPINDEIADGVGWSPSFNAVSTALGVSRLISASIGLNIGEYWGVELVGQAFTPQMVFTETDKKFGKYAVFAFLPQLRLRYPLAGGRVSPYVVGGVGLAYGEFTHEKPRGQDLEPVSGKGYGLAAAIGVGVDYFVAKNIALVAETDYQYARTSGFELQGRGLDVNADAFLASVGLRIFFPAARPLWGK